MSSSPASSAAGKGDENSGVSTAAATNSDSNKDGAGAVDNATAAAAATEGPFGYDFTTNTDEKPMSKSQIKKKRRWEKAMEIKKRRKQQEKEVKIAKAKAEGRDLEKERLIHQQNTENGLGKKKRQEEWERKKIPLIKQSFECCIDCSFENQMTFREINSLSGQIRYCYSENRKNPHPCQLTVTSLSGRTFENLQNVAGFDEWTTRAFQYSDKCLQDVYQDRLKDIVYLTSDSENVVEELDNSKIYIIGGIVDRGRLPKAAITRAEQLGVATARLPLEEHLQKMQTTKVLTVNHVFEILLKWREHGKNWEKALLDVLPSRKGIAPKEKDGNDSASTKEKDKTPAKDNISAKHEENPTKSSKRDAGVDPETVSESKRVKE